MKVPQSLGYELTLRLSILIVLYVVAMIILLSLLRIVLHEGVASVAGCQVIHGLKSTRAVS